jgi:hypothetical protein
MRISSSSPIANISRNVMTPLWLCRLRKSLQATDGDNSSIATIDYTTRAITLFLFSDRLHLLKSSAFQTLGSGWRTGGVYLSTPAMLALRFWKWPGMSLITGAGANFPDLSPAAIKAYLVQTATHQNLGANPHAYGLLDLATYGRLR